MFRLRTALSGGGAGSGGNGEFLPRETEPVADRLGSRRLQDHAHLVEDVLLARKLIGREDPLILDFGAGECTWGGTAHALGCRVVCYDLHDAIVECAANYGLKAVALAEIAPGSLDYINADQVFEHLAQPLGQLRELVPLLRLGGLIKISTPGDRRMKSKLQSTNFESLSPEAFGAGFSALGPAAASPALFPRAPCKPWAAAPACGRSAFRRSRPSPRRCWWIRGGNSTARCAIRSIAGSPAGRGSGFGGLEFSAPGRYESWHVALRLRRPGSVVPGGCDGASSRKSPAASAKASAIARAPSAIATLGRRREPARNSRAPGPRADPNPDDIRLGHHLGVGRRGGRRDLLFAGDPGLVRDDATG